MPDMAGISKGKKKILLRWTEFTVHDWILSWSAGLNYDLFVRNKSNANRKGTFKDKLIVSFTLNT